MMRAEEGESLRSRVKNKSLGLDSLDLSEDRGRVREAKAKVELGARLVAHPVRSRND